LAENLGSRKETETEETKKQKTKTNRNKNKEKNNNKAKKKGALILISFGCIVFDIKLFTISLLK
jgi:hypothetical protein